MVDIQSDIFVTSTTHTVSAGEGEHHQNPSDYRHEESASNETEIVYLKKDFEDSELKSKRQVFGDLVLYTANDACLGSGFFGMVFAGEYKGQKCAVKVLNNLGVELKTELPATSGDGSMQRNHLKKFKRECEYLQNLRHENLVRHIVTLPYPKDENFPMLVMERLDCNLTKYLKDHEHEQLSEQIQISLAFDVANGLTFIHENGIIHRDLCGVNVLLDCSRGEIPVAKIADFGISRFVDLENLSKTLTSLVGHRGGCLPPEAVTKNYNSSLDIFMYGVLLIQIVKAVPHIKSELERDYLMGQIRREHPLHGVIVHCLTKNQDRRPPASDVRNALSELKANPLARVMQPPDNSLSGRCSRGLKALYSFIASLISLSYWPFNLLMACLMFFFFCDHYEDFNYTLIRSNSQYVERALVYILCFFVHLLLVSASSQQKPRV